jgi:hypothetical protein
MRTPNRAYWIENRDGEPYFVIAERSNGKILLWDISAMSVRSQGHVLAPTQHHHRRAAMEFGNSVLEIDRPADSTSSPQ